MPGAGVPLAAGPVTPAPSAVTLLAERAAARPADLALVVDGGDDLTFAAWERRSGGLADALADRRVQPGDRVALRFDARRWAGYAVAYVGVLKAGAVAVMVPAGLGPADAARIVRHSGAIAMVCPPELAVLASDFTWTKAPGEPDVVVGLMPGARALGTLRDGATDVVRSARDPGPVSGSEAHDVVYARSPMARPRVLARCADGLRPPPAGSGWLVHTWAPGSPEGQRTLGHALSGTETGAATLARFSAEALGVLVRRLGAAACGLTPALAAAVASSPDASHVTLGSVAALLIGPSDHRAPPIEGLTATFPAATIHHLGEPPERTPAPATVGSTPALGDNSSRQNDGGGPGDPGWAPAGASQVGMLWHEQLAPGSFNLPALVRRYRGPLDVGALERALAELVRRHEPLRTTFELVAGSPRQVVRPPPPPGLDLVDLGPLPPVTRNAEAARLVGEASSRPFDLVDGPLFDPRLLRLGDDDHVLVVRLHHAAFDDWSVDVFRRQLSALYTAYQAGEPSTLPEPAVRFVDVARAQQSRLGGPDGDGQRAWWRAQMAGAPLAVQLPLGEPYQIGPDRPGAGEPVRHDLSADLSRSVRALAPRLRATPFMIVLAAFGVLVARRTGQDDLVIASVVAGRGATAQESMIGCFTKKVLLRLRLDGDPTFAELVTRTRATILAALAAQDLPFEAVVQETLGPAAAAHGLVPQVPIVFQGETPQKARLVMPGLTVGPFEVPASARREQHFSAGRHDAPGDDAIPKWGDGAYLGTFLLLSLLEGADGLALVARGVFHRPAAQLLLEELDRLLADIADDPDRPLSALAPARAGRSAAPVDDLEVRGLRLHRSRIEAALTRCPGVAEVAVTVTTPDDGPGHPRLVAYVVADRDPPPTLVELRRALWAALPGSPWPASAVVVRRLRRLDDGRLDVDALPAPAADATDPTAVLLSYLWSTVSGGAVSPATVYWQDFSFLQALADARAAGLPLTDEQVSRSRTPEVLAAALAAAEP